MSNTLFKQYDVVKIIGIQNDKLLQNDEFSRRGPRIGDIATIVEVYSEPAGYELECSDADGITEWLLAFSPEDIQLKNIE